MPPPEPESSELPPGGSQNHSDCQYGLETSECDAGIAFLNFGLREAYFSIGPI